DRRGRAGLYQGLAEEQLLHQAGALAPVLDRPVEPDVAGLEHLLLPGAALIDRVPAGAVAGGSVPGALGHLRLVGTQPGDRLVLELALLGGQVEIHGLKATRSRVPLLPSGAPGPRRRRAGSAARASGR